MVSAPRMATAFSTRCVGPDNVEGYNSSSGRSSSRPSARKGAPKPFCGCPDGAKTATPHHDWNPGDDGLVEVARQVLPLRGDCQRPGVGKIIRSVAAPRPRS
jgi:hypothetical protein